MAIRHQRVNVTTTPVRLDWANPSDTFDGDSVMVQNPDSATTVFLGGPTLTYVSISSITVSGTTVTVNTSSAHALIATSFVQISGATNSANNGFFTVTEVPNNTSFKFTNASGVAQAGAAGLALSYGYALGPGQTFSIDMQPFEMLYGVVATGSVVVNTLTQGA